MGAERTKFVTTVRDSTFYPEKTDGETVSISKKISENTHRLMAEQMDPSHLTKQALPQVPAVYSGPTIAGNGGMALNPRN